MGTFIGYIGDMSEDVQIKKHGDIDIPIIFVPRGNAAQSRREMAEELIGSLLQDEKFLQALRENETCRIPVN